MVDVVSANNFDERQPNDFHVKPKGTLFQVLSIKFNLDRNRQIVAPIDLSPAGESGHQRIDARLRAQSNQVVLIKERRPWTYKAHIPFENAVELRQFIKTRLAQKAADGRKPMVWILKQMRGYFGRINAHASKFRHAENRVVNAHSVRPIKNRSWACKLDRQRDHC